jgi:hypothetical protein
VDAADYTVWRNTLRQHAARQLRDKEPSMVQIAHNLYGQKFRTYQNKAFTPTAVWRILNDAAGGAAGHF